MMLIKTYWKNLVKILFLNWSFFIKLLEGVARTTEYEMDEIMPSCCPLMFLDYFYIRCCTSSKDWLFNVHIIWTMFNKYLSVITDNWRSIKLKEFENKIIVACSAAPCKSHKLLLHYFTIFQCWHDSCWVELTRGMQWGLCCNHNLNHLAFLCPLWIIFIYNFQHFLWICKNFTME